VHFEFEFKTRSGQSVHVDLEIDPEAAARWLAQSALTKSAAHTRVCGGAIVANVRREPAQQPVCRIVENNASESK
jgi:hypothetical protein